MNNTRILPPPKQSTQTKTQPPSNAPKLYTTQPAGKENSTMKGTSKPSMSSDRIVRKGSNTNTNNVTTANPYPGACLDTTNTNINQPPQDTQDVYYTDLQGNEIFVDDDVNVNVDAVGGKFHGSNGDGGNGATGNMSNVPMGEETHGYYNENANGTQDFQLPAYTGNTTQSRMKDSNDASDGNPKHKDEEQENEPDQDNCPDQELEQDHELESEQDPDWDEIAKHEPGRTDTSIFLAARDRRRAAEERFGVVLDEAHDSLKQCVDDVLQVAVEMFHIQKEKLDAMEHGITQDLIRNEEARAAMHKKLEETAAAAEAHFAQLMRRVTHFGKSVSGAVNQS